MRPLADRVEGIDRELRLVIAAADLDANAAAVLRVAAAAYIRVHGNVLEHLEEGGQAALLVAEGVVPCWGDDIEAGPLGPMRGGEMHPVARAVLAELGDDADTAVNAAVRVLPVLRAEGSFESAVTVELLEALVFTHTVTP